MGRRVPDRGRARQCCRRSHDRRELQRQAGHHDRASAVSADPNDPSLSDLAAWRRASALRSSRSSSWFTTIRQTTTFRTPSISSRLPGSSCFPRCRCRQAIWAGRVSPSFPPAADAVSRLRLRHRIGRRVSTCTTLEPASPWRTRLDLRVVLRVVARSAAPADDRLDRRRRNPAVAPATSSKATCIRDGLDTIVPSRAPGCGVVRRARAPMSSRLAASIAPPRPRRVPRAIDDPHFDLTGQRRHCSASPVCPSPRRSRLPWRAPAHHRWTRLRAREKLDARLARAVEARIGEVLVPQGRADRSVRVVSGRLSGDGWRAGWSGRRALRPPAHHPRPSRPPTRACRAGDALNSSRVLSIRRSTPPSHRRRRVDHPQVRVPMRQPCNSRRVVARSKPASRDRRGLAPRLSSTRHDSPRSSSPVLLRAHDVAKRRCRRECAKLLRAARSTCSRDPARPIRLRCCACFRPSRMESRVFEETSPLDSASCTRHRRASERSRRPTRDLRRAWRTAPLRDARSATIAARGGGGMVGSRTDAARCRSPRRVVRAF